MSDLISRQAAIDALWQISNERDSVYYTSAIHSAVDAIEALPSAERRGRWEDVEHAPNGLLYATCSVCGKRKAIESVNYCGECGARMEASE